MGFLNWLRRKRIGDCQHCRDTWGQYIKLVHESCEWERRARRAERLLVDGLAPKELARAHHLKDLEEKNERLKCEVRAMQLKAEQFNRQLFATGLIVNCTGCIPGAPAGFVDVTEERVKEVEHIAGRLRAWWNCNRSRLERIKQELKPD